MERCPNCGAPARPGAKFCTTCGYQLADNGDAEAVPAPEAETTVVAEQGGNGTIDDAAVAGWPSPPPPDLPANGGTTEHVTLPAPVADAAEETTSGVTAPAWPSPPVDSWPSAPSAQTEPTDVEEPVIAETAPFAATVPTVQPASEVSDPLTRAERLLAELQVALTEIGRLPTGDLSGVLSDMEVALTPPEALAGDALAELRDALFAARERPRDIDTIVDLTRRIDALVALVIAYDRTIAAIERALAVLRREGNRC